MSRTDFTTIRTEGALLPPGLLKRLREPKNGLPGTDDAAYHVTPPRRLSEVISEAWNTLQGTWTAYRDARDGLPDSDTGTTLTRERWLQPLFQALGYGRLLTRTATTIDGVAFPISHGWHHVPIHLVSHRVDLDRRTAGVAGAARTSPHGLVQTYLNATDDSLWGIVSNGHRLRLLRDHHALTRPSYVEYDLEAMFDGEVYSDFVLLFLTLHQSRLEAAAPTETLLEQWATLAREQGTRALDRLRDGVERALKALGQGFLDHPANGALRERLRSGDLDAQDYYRQLLRIVYRLLVLFAAEDRDLLHPPDTSDAARERYQHYGTRRLREIADRVRGGPHHDRYETLKRLTRWLANDGAPALGVPALGGSLYDPDATPDLDTAHLANHAYLAAIRALAFTTDDGAHLPVDYRNLGAEELGSVYESLLELHPTFEHDRFALTTAAGNERKTTGSYYTPTSLITLLLDSALDPVLDDAARAPNPERAILDLKIVDPSSGSGHFLIAAAHRVARRLAQVRTGDDEPAVDTTRTALRDVIGHCLYAVDLNPMAIELCKVALWLEALEPGKPLTFIDHHVKTGNSLLGLDPRLTSSTVVDAGIPDEAFRPIGEDDKGIARGLLDANRAERAGQMTLFQHSSTQSDSALVGAVQHLEDSPDEDAGELRKKEQTYAALLASSAYVLERAIGDAWCGSFAWPKTRNVPRPITTRDLRTLSGGEHLENSRTAYLAHIASDLRFFHWRTEFPQVFNRAKSGFDVLLGNPPFLGGLKISSQFGERYRSLLSYIFEPLSGRADLSASFFRLAHRITQPEGRIGLIATNTISQGATRESGLAVLLRDGAQITHATPGLRWPGDANVEVTAITVAPTHSASGAYLDGVAVQYISSRLDAQPELHLAEIARNRGRSFQGSVVLGAGFVLSQAQATALIESDPRSAEVILPYYSGEDINNSPDLRASRWVIQFGERTEAEASTYEAAWRHVQEHVKPVRMTKDAKKYPRMVHEWWKHWNNRFELYRSTRPLSRVLARSRVSDLHMLAFLPSDAIYSDATVVFAFEDYANFALLQSDIHEVWIRREASTMRTDVRYTPTDCFLTFPFPDSSPIDSPDSHLERVGRDLYEFRSALQVKHRLGLTSLYNRFHDPDQSDPEIVELRSHHLCVTHAVIKAYGWNTVEPKYTFLDTGYGRVRLTLDATATQSILQLLNIMNASQGSRKRG